MTDKLADARARAADYAKRPSKHPLDRFPTLHDWFIVTRPGQAPVELFVPDRLTLKECAALYPGAVVEPRPFSGTPTR